MVVSGAVCKTALRVQMRRSWAQPLRSLRLLAALGSLMWLALGLRWFRGIRDVPVLEDLRKPGVP